MRGKKIPYRRNPKFLAKALGARTGLMYSQKSQEASEAGEEHQGGCMGVGVGT